MSLELKRVDGLNNLKELYPFQFKLASLDNLRQDGKFIVDGSIPEGQGTLNALLAECFDIVQELKIELEEKEIENGDEGEDDLTGSFTNSKTIGNGNNELTDDDVEIKEIDFMILMKLIMTWIVNQIMMMMMMMTMTMIIV